MVDQRNLNTTTCIADMAAELENDRRENVRKLSQAHDVSARTVYAAHENGKALKEVGQVGEKTEMKKGQFRTCEAVKAMAATIL